MAIVSWPYTPWRYVTLCIIRARRRCGLVSNYSDRLLLMLLLSRMMLMPLLLVVVVMMTTKVSISWRHSIISRKCWSAAKPTSPVMPFNSFAEPSQVRPPTGAPFLPARRYASAGTSCGPASVCLSVCLSVCVCLCPSVCHKSVFYQKEWTD